MALGIPLPGSNFDTFAKGLGTGSDVMQRIVMNPYDQRLKEAEANKSAAEAKKAQMLTDLISSVGSGADDKQKRGLMMHMLGLPELPSDKRAGELQLKIDEAREKKRQDIIDHAYALQGGWKQLKRIKDVFNRRPELTGPVQGNLADWHASTDEDLGKAITGFAKVQSNLSKSASARPGIGSINWAGIAKMNAKDPMKMNWGKLNETMEDLRAEYDTLRQQYNTATGQNMPTFDDFMEETPKQQQKQMKQVQETVKAVQPYQAPKQRKNGPEVLPPQESPYRQEQGEAVPLSPSQKAFADKVYKAMPPDMQAEADEAVDQGADPMAVVMHAAQVLGMMAGGAPNQEGEPNTDNLLHMELNTGRRAKE